MTSKIDERVAVIGLGYVGLPVALAFAKVCPTVGFDIDEARIQALQKGIDTTREVAKDALLASGAQFTADPEGLRGISFFVVTVPTPVDRNHRPDLRPLMSACALIGPYLSPGAVVSFESTVYPGLTEEECGPALEQASGLTAGVDFKLAYSPERINPGDKEHTLDKIIKIVSAQDHETLERAVTAYDAIVPAGIHKAPSIKVAEAAKVIENTQRDINIALVNELAMICDRLDIATADVLAAARTKWNFLDFRPGLVGGHCVGVDPYYLTSKAESLGYYPEVILAGRRINDSMGKFVAQKVIKFLAQRDKPLKDARVGILGVTFKEDVPDVRNSLVPGIIKEFQGFGISPLVHDCYADPDLQFSGVKNSPISLLSDLDAVLLAVPHKTYIDGSTSFSKLLVEGGRLFDLKGGLQKNIMPSEVSHLTLML